MSDQARRDPTRVAGQLQNAVIDFHRFITSLPEEAVTEKACGPKEVLAHNVFWIESYVGQVDATLAGKTPTPPQGRFDDLNAQAVAASRGIPIAELLRRHQAACEWLCGVARSHDPERIVFVLKQGSACRHSLTWYLAAEANHIRWHQRILVRQAQREYLSDIEQLRGTVDAFCRFVEDLPEAAHAERARGPRAALGYLTFWHEHYVGQIEAQLAGKAFAGPRERLKDLNAQAATTASGVPVDELVRRFQVADVQLRDFGQTLDPQQILVEVQGYLHTLDGAIERIATHIHNQQRKLERELKGRKLPR